MTGGPARAHLVGPGVGRLGGLGDRHVLSARGTGEATPLLAGGAAVQVGGQAVAAEGVHARQDLGAPEGLHADAAGQKGLLDVHPGSAHRHAARQNYGGSLASKDKNTMQLYCRVSVQLH